MKIFLKDHSILSKQKHSNKKGQESDIAKTSSMKNLEGSNTHTYIPMNIITQYNNVHKNIMALI